MYVYVIKIVVICIIKTVFKTLYMLHYLPMLCINVIFVSKVSSETRDILDEGKKKKGLFDKTGFRMGGKFGAAAKMRGLR